MTATVRCKLGNSWSLSLLFFGSVCFSDDDGLAWQLMEFVAAFLRVVLLQR